MIRSTYILIAMAYSLAITAQSAAQDTVRQRNYYPVGVPMDEETVEWRQDVYREIDLSNKANAALYSPADQNDRLTGLFANIFDMAIQGKAKLYKYEIDGNEKLTPRNELTVKSILDDYHITYTADSTGQISINCSDMPYSDINTYYIKEAVYYDAVNSSFRNKVLAICPVMILEDEFSDHPVRYPLFWVRYSDIQSRLKDIIFSPEANNLAMRMTMDDYFVLNRYQGSIFKVYNEQATTLSMYCKDDSTMAQEQKRIEGRLKDVRNKTYNVYHSEKKKADSQQAKPVEKIRYRWAMPWQKKKAAEATKNEKKNAEKQENKNVVDNK